jgi:nitrous oxide reductase accessory protein NosL
MSECRPFHVLIDIDRSRFHARLREIEAWIAEWQMDAEIGSVLGETGQLRIRFADQRAAYAFQRCHGGRTVPADEIEAAKLADVADEGLYDRLAREYPD